MQCSASGGGRRRKRDSSLSDTGNSALSHLLMSKNIWENSKGSDFLLSWGIYIWHSRPSLNHKYFWKSLWGWERNTAGGQARGSPIRATLSQLFLAPGNYTHRGPELLIAPPPGQAGPSEWAVGSGHLVTRRLLLCCGCETFKRPLSENRHCHILSRYYFSAAVKFHGTSAHWQCLEPTGCDPNHNSQGTNCRGSPDPALLSHWSFARCLLRYWLSRPLVEFSQVQSGRYGQGGERDKDFNGNSVKVH